MQARSRRYRRTVAALTILSCTVAAWVVFAVAVIGHPTLAQQANSADAVVVLGPSNKRVAQATTLARHLGIDDVALSVGDFHGQAGTCRQPGLRIHCFVPAPYNTQGEAAEIGAMARDHGWHRIIVISATPQASRARWLIERCFPGDIQMVAATNSESRPTSLEWIYQSIYQTVAFAKDSITYRC